MPPPVIIPVSSSELNVTWSKPTPEQSRGEVTRYTLWHYQATDLEKLPFAPPYSWVVSVSVMLCQKITRFRMLSTLGQLILLTESGIEAGFLIQITLLNHLNRIHAFQVDLLSPIYCFVLHRSVSSKIVLIFNSLLQILYSEPGFSPMFYLVKNLPAFTNQEFRIEMCNSVGCINSSDTTAKTLLSGKSLTLQTYDSGEYHKTSKTIEFPKERSITAF